MLPRKKTLFIWPPWTPNLVPPTVLTMSYLSPRSYSRLFSSFPHAPGAVVLSSRVVAYPTHERIPGKLPRMCRFPFVVCHSRTTLQTLLYTQSHQLHHLLTPHAQQTILSCFRPRPISGFGHRFVRKSRGAYADEAVPQRERNTRVPSL